LQQPGHFKQLRHELRTCLNHIIGYAEILVTDAREYNHERYIPALQGILKKAEKIRKLISFFFGDDTDLLEIATPDDIRKAFYVPLVQMIGDSRRLLVTFQVQEPILVRDMERLIEMGVQMLDVVEAEIVELDIEDVQLHVNPEGPEKEKEPSLDSIPSFKEFEAELGDGLAGMRARIPGHILIVDDSVAVQNLLSRHLSALGHVTRGVSSGPEALEYLQENPTDIVILDVLMPGMTGYQVLREMKKNPALRELPVIMISSIENSENIAQCIKLGAEDFLPKNFEPVILRARVDACMEKRHLQKQQQVYLQAIIQSQQALARELSDAAQYILGLLPEPIHTNTIQTGIAFIPSAQLGGDFVSHHFLDDEHLALFVLDVAGHGVKSALLSVSLFNTLENQAIPGADFLNPGDVLTKLNASYQQSIEANTYFTLWYGVYNVRTRVLSYANGGSPPGILVTPSSTPQIQEMQELTTEDMLLGAVEDYTYQTKTTELVPGANLYVFSDGIYEIQRSSGRILGIRELERLMTIQTKSAQENLDDILNQVRAISSSQAFEDDITLLSLRILE